VPGSAGGSGGREGCAFAQRGSGARALTLECSLTYAPKVREEGVQVEVMELTLRGTDFFTLDGAGFNVNTMELEMKGTLVFTEMGKYWARLVLDGLGKGQARGGRHGEHHVRDCVRPCSMGEGCVLLWRGSGGRMLITECDPTRGLRASRRESRCRRACCPSAATTTAPGTRDSAHRSASWDVSG